MRCLGTGKSSNRRLSSVVWRRVLGLFVAACLLACSGLDACARDGRRTITDRTGRVVDVPVEPEKIACFFGPSYEKVFLLGAADKIVAMSIIQPPWSRKLNPKLSDVTIMPSYSNPDVERILQSGGDHGTDYTLGAGGHNSSKSRLCSIIPLFSCRLNLISLHHATPPWRLWRVGNSAWEERTKWKRRSARENPGLFGRGFHITAGSWLQSIENWG